MPTSHSAPLQTHLRSSKRLQEFIMNLWYSCAAQGAEWADRPCTGENEPEILKHVGATQSPGRPFAQWPGFDFQGHAPSGAFWRARWQSRRLRLPASGALCNFSSRIFFSAQFCSASGWHRLAKNWNNLWSLHTILEVIERGLLPFLSEN